MQDLVSDTNQALKLQQLLSNKIESLKGIEIFDWKPIIKKEIPYEFLSKYSVLLMNFSNKSDPRIYSVKFYDSEGTAIEEQCNHTISGFSVHTYNDPILLIYSEEPITKWCEDYNEVYKSEDWIQMDNSDLQTQKIIGITILQTAQHIIFSSGEYADSSIDLDMDSDNIRVQFNYISNSYHHGDN